MVVENGISDERLLPEHVKDKLRLRDEIISSNDLPRGSVVKSSGHNDTIVKDGWKPTGRKDR